MIADDTRERLYKQLEACYYLEDGWNSYNSPKPNHDSILHAELLLEYLRIYTNLEPSSVIPSADGGVSYSLNDTPSNRVLIAFYNEYYSSRTLFEILYYERDGSFTKSINFDSLTELLPELAIVEKYLEEGPKIFL